jgi:hypothetical protein
MAHVTLAASAPKSKSAPKNMSPAIPAVWQSIIAIGENSVIYITTWHYFKKAKTIY